MARRSGPSHDQFMAACNTEASRLLRGKRILEVRYLTAEECRQLTWSFACVALVLDDGTAVYPAKDSEGNEACSLHGTTGKGEPFVLPEVLSRT